MANPLPTNPIVSQGVVHLIELNTTLHFPRSTDRHQPTINAFRAALTKLSFYGFALPEVEVYVVPADSTAAKKPRASYMRDDKGHMSLFMRGDFLSFRGEARSIADQASQRAHRGGVLGRRLRTDEMAARRAELTLAKATVIHELGHALHEHQSPEIYWMQKVDGQALHRPGLAAWVSPHAVTDSLEFVAEVFTALMLGYSFDKRVMSHYLELGGPARHQDRKARAVATQVRHAEAPPANDAVEAPA